VSTNAVAQWERGSMPGADYRPLIAQLYGIDEDLLFAEVAERMAAHRALLTR
jgi:transcriptional regulator with XRE-family HTH domain